MSGVYSCLSSRRGNVVEETKREGTPLVQVGMGLVGGPDPSQVDPVVGIIPHFNHGVSQPDPWTKKHVKNHG